MRDLYDWTIKLTGVVAVSGLVYQTYLFYFRRRGRGEEEINEALFFPEDTSKTFKSNQHFVKKFLQGGGVVINSDSNLAKVLGYVRNAKVSVDVCLYIFTCPEFGNILVSCMRRGIIIRVIVDFVSIQEYGLEVNRLRMLGVPVRGRKQEHHMHHKFVIIDSSILLNGSFNWTQTAVTGNNENVIITSNKHVVGEFVNEFSKLWKIHNKI